jgi:hypothetical protein
MTSRARTIAEIAHRFLVPSLRGTARDVSERKLELLIERFIDDETEDLWWSAYHRGLSESGRD